MRTIRFPLSSFLTLMAVILSACNMPVSEATAEDELPTAQPIMQATETQPAPTKVIPTETSTTAATETLTPEPSATFTPEPPMAKVVRESNCRIGPGGAYDLVATYPVDQVLDVIGKGLAEGYWFVQNPEKPEELCYVSAQNVTIIGETASLPQFTPQPSPTAAPYFLAKFWKFDACEGRSYAVFNIENAGSIPFRSVYIRVVEGKKGLSVDGSYNAFDLRVKCVLAKNIAPLNPGASGYVYSPEFKWSGQGEKLKATIMACTEKNLKGTCVTQSLDLKK